MKLVNEFDVPLGPDETWAVLMDIERIVTCVPGAELIENAGDRTYKGKIAVKLGPVALAFIGSAKFVETDETTKVAKVSAQGADKKGRGGAKSDVVFALTPIPGGTRVVVDTDLNLSGSVAQYGRASGMIESVAAEITKEFAANLGKQIDQAPHAAPGAVGAPPKAAPISGFRLLLNAFRRRVTALFVGKSA